MYNHYLKFAACKGGGGAGLYIFLVGLAAVFQTLIFCLQVRHEMGILTNKNGEGRTAVVSALGVIRDVLVMTLFLFKSKPGLFLQRALNKKM